MDPTTTPEAEIEQLTAQLAAETTRRVALIQAVGLAAGKLINLSGEFVSASDCLAQIQALPGIVELPGAQLDEFKRLADAIGALIEDRWHHREFRRRIAQHFANEDKLRSDSAK